MSLSGRVTDISYNHDGLLDIEGAGGLLKSSLSERKWTLEWVAL
jgi:hypothetical protein